MATTHAPIDPKFYVRFNDRTLEVDPHREAELTNDYERYTAFVLFDDWVTQFFVPDTDFISLTLRYRAILAMAYAKAEQTGGAEYGMLPSHDEYLAAVAFFNEGIATRKIKLRERKNRPNPTPATPVAALPTADELAAAGADPLMLVVMEVLRQQGATLAEVAARINRPNALVRGARTVGKFMSAKPGARS